MLKLILFPISTPTCRRASSTRRPMAINKRALIPHSRTEISWHVAFHRRQTSKLMMSSRISIILRARRRWMSPINNTSINHRVGQVGEALAPALKDQNLTEDMRRRTRSSTSTNSLSKKKSQKLTKREPHGQAKTV